MADQPYLRIIPHKLRARRLEACLTQLELAQKTGLSEAWILEIEAGRANGTRPNNVRKLAEGIGCSPSEISEVVEVAS